MSWAHSISGSYSWSVILTYLISLAYRGAGSSKGRTSWQSKPEQNDYVSFIGFMVYYIHHLSPPTLSPPPIQQPNFSRSEPQLHELTPVPSQALPPPHVSVRYLSPMPKHLSLANKDQGKPRIRLLLGGYSYGAMVTCCLPAILSSVITPFQSPAAGSAHAEIRLRALSLATQQNSALHSQISFLLRSSQQRRGRSFPTDELSSPRGRKSAGAVRMGGEEDIRRASHDSYRSRSSFTIETQERVRKSVDRVRSFTKSSRFSPRRQNSHGSVVSYKTSEHGSDSSLDNSSPVKETPGSKSCEPIPALADQFCTAYLLISPLQGILSSLATMWSTKALRERDFLSENEIKFTIDPTLALFADDDIFVSVKRLRSWAEKLEKAGKEKEGKGRMFRYREIEGGGHFWHDKEALEALLRDVGEFVASL
jgi:hypothetical protein